MTEIKEKKLKAKRRKKKSCAIKEEIDAGGNTRSAK